MFATTSEARRFALGVDGNRGSVAGVRGSSHNHAADRQQENVISGSTVLVIGHHSGGHLGNFARNDTNKLEDKARPTIDQLMAYSSSFYPDEKAIKKRSMHVGVDGHLSVSWGWSNPTQRSGNIQPVPSSLSSKDLFDSIFVRQATPQASARMPGVDRCSTATGRSGTAPSAMQSGSRPTTVAGSKSTWAESPSCSSA